MATINFSFQNFQYIMCSLDRLIQEHGLSHSNRCQFFEYVMKMFGDYVVSSNSKGVRGRPLSVELSEEGYKMASNYYGNKKRNKKDGYGYIYCFFAMNGDGCRYLKIGKSVNWRRRLKQYPGPAKPTEVVGTLHVRHMVTAEQKMLTRFRRWFDQFDREWFRIPHGFEKLVRDLFFQPLQDKLEG